MWSAPRQAVRRIGGRFCTRAVLLRDQVLLSPSATPKAGLQTGEILIVIQHDQTDPITPYCVRHPKHPEKIGWFGADELMLADAAAPAPKPEPPGPNM